MDVSNSMTTATPDQKARLEALTAANPRRYNSNGPADWSSQNTGPFACHAVFKRGGKGATAYVLHAASSDNFVSEGSGVTFDGTVTRMRPCASSPASTILASSKDDITAATAEIIASALSQPTFLTHAGAVTPTGPVQPVP